MHSRLAALSVLCCLMLSACATAPASSKITTQDLVSWDVRAMQLVADQGFPPTIASQLYASLAKAQDQAVKAGDSVLFAEVGEGVFCRFRGACAEVASAAAAPILAEVDALREVMKTAPLPVRPTGPNIWEGMDPVTPNAGSWPLRMHVTGDAPNPPPVRGSPQDLEQLRLAREAVLNITPAQRERVLFWAGSKGTETPAGLWLSQFDDWVRPQPVLAASRARLIFTAAMADAFVHCWQAKFTYWTERPTVRDSSIKPVIPVPNFPSYPSGHATVSFTAGQILAGMSGDQKYLAMALEAADSRVWAGLHFPVDAEGGKLIGNMLAADALSAWKH